MPTPSVDIRDRIARVTLNNPGKLNALDVQGWQGVARVFRELSADAGLRCVILCGAEGNFAAGADIAEFPAVRSSFEAGMRYHTELIAGALKAIEECVHPTIAAIEGVCVGGGLELASMCDLRIAHPRSRFGIPIHKLGFPLAPGELVGLLQLVGRAVTLEILLEGRVFDGHEALQKGLVNRLTEDVPTEATQTARRIAQGAPLAARMSKQLVRKLAPTPEALSEEDLRAAFSFLHTEDYREGVRAFLAKEPPQFKGH